MEKAVQNSSLQLVIELINEFKKGNYNRKVVPDDLPREVQEILVKLNELGRHLNVQRNSNNQPIESLSIFKALQESEQRYRTLVESSPFCIHEIDRDGKIISMNPAGLSMIGVDNLNDVCGTPYLDLVDDSDKDEVKSLMDSAFKGKQSNFEFASGQGETTLYFKSSFIPIWNASEDDQSEVIKLMGITQNVTDTHLVKKALQESKESLRIVIDSIEEIVYAIDFKDSDPNTGDIIYLSPQVEKAIGYEVKEFIDNSSLWFSLIHPEDIESVVEQTKKLLQTKKTITRSYRLRHKKSNEYIWFEDKVSPKVNEDGIVYGYVGGARDISERKQTEQALLDSEEKYRTFFEKAPIGIGLTDHEGNLIAYNNAILKPGNYEPGDAKKLKNVKDLYYDPKDRSAVRNQLQESGSVDQMEILLKKKDGSPYHALLSLTPLTLDSQPYLMALVKDISETKTAEEALEESLLRNRTIVENVQEAIVIFESGRKKFIDFNDNAIALFGFSGEELRKMTPAHLSPEFQPDGRPSEEAAFEKISKALNGESQVFEWMHRNKNGDEFPCEVHLTSIPYKDRRVVMGSVVDISERKKAENERESLIRELDRFVYSASHDLSAPLKSILGLLNVTRMESNEPVINGYLDKMEQSINKLEDFIREIIQYSRNSRLELRVEKIDLDTLVNEILEDLKFTEGYDDIDFEIDFSSLPDVETDLFRLKVVLNNFLSNSIKFHQKKHDNQPFVKITGKSEKGKKIIDIIDNGQGISKENLTKIFDMFYRGSHTSSGSGLGLYIAKEAAQNMGGELKVESEYGKGSTFSVILS